MARQISKYTINVCDWVLNEITRIEKKANIVCKTEFKKFISESNIHILDVTVPQYKTNSDFSACD